MPTVLNPTGAPSIFGGIGRLEFSQGAPDDPFPVWTDITVFMRTEDFPVASTRGRQTELDSNQPSQLTVILDNTDNRFTFGLTSGPYGSGWAPAKKVRYSETIGQRTFVLFTGWIEFPDVDDWQPIGLKYVQLTCTDRPTRLSRGRKFVSTLAEHILYNATVTGGMVACWPMTDATTRQNDISPNATAGYLTVGQINHLSGAAITGPTFTPQRGTQIPGDDLTPGLFTPILSGTATAYAGYVNRTDLSLTVNSTVLTITWWQWWDDVTTDFVFPLTLTGGGNTLQLFRTTTTWRVAGTVPGATITYDINPVPTRKWTYCALRMTLPSGQIEFWQDAQPAQNAVMVGAPPSSATFTTLQIGDDFGGSVAYVQVYIGGLYNNAVHQAQFRMGFNGLEYQSTGQRINTLLDYAGVPSTDRAIDPGQSFMQRATLAGLDPQTAIQNAVNTERGRGFAAGDGRYVFHDRIRTLNL